MTRQKTAGKYDADYNVKQSKIAIGSGGFAGKGLFKGTQTRYGFVPEQRTDFIFDTIGEGLDLSEFVLFGIYLVLLFRIVAIAERQRSVFSRCYAYGVAAVFFFHIAINLAMTVGLAPVIGIPLPFISYGGTSLLTLRFFYLFLYDWMLTGKWSYVIPIRLEVELMNLNSRIIAELGYLLGSHGDHSLSAKALSRSTKQNYLFHLMNRSRSAGKTCWQSACRNSAFCYYYFKGYFVT